MSGHDHLDRIIGPVGLQQLSIFRQARGGQRSTRQHRQHQADSPDPYRGCTLLTRHHSTDFSLGSKDRLCGNSSLGNERGGKGQTEIKSLS